jgi:hypothetical protein
VVRPLCGGHAVTIPGKFLKGPYGSAGDGGVSSRVPLGESLISLWLI